MGMPRMQGASRPQRAAMRDGSTVAVVSDGSTVTAEASVTVHGLGGWFSVLPDVTLSAEAHALAEDAEGIS